MSSEQLRSQQRRFPPIDWRIPLLVGFVAVTTAVVVAYRHPSTGFELSIYTETPVSFWVCIAVALFLSTVVAFSGTRGWVRSLGVVLGGLSILTVLSLPLLRGYRYLGKADALSHLGIARDLNAGVIEMTDIHYPALHTLASVTSDITGIALADALLLYVVIFGAVFLVFVPLAVSELVTEPTATTVGAFSAFLFLPIAQVHSPMQPFPTTQALLFGPLLLFLYFGIVQRSDWRFPVLFTIASFAFVLVHPQQAANFFIFFGAFAATQIGHELIRRPRPAPVFRLTFPVLAFIIVFWLWIRNFPAFETSFSGFVSSLYEQTVPGETVATRATGLSAAGGSYTELFLKLFLVPLVYVLVAGFVLVGTILATVGVSRLSVLRTLVPSDRNERLVLVYVAGAFVPIVGLFVAYVAGSISDQYFRHYAFMMVIVTVVGAVGLGYVLEAVTRWRSSTAASTTAICLFVVFLLLTVPVLFMSPYLLLPSHHVTDAEMSGHEFAFEHESAESTYDYVRFPVHRYGNAILGQEDRPNSEYYREGEWIAGTPDHFADRDLRAYFDDDEYLTVTRADRVREPVLYDGFRFDRGDYAYLDTEPGIDRVVTNDEFDLYLVRPDADDGEDDPSSAQQRD